MVGRPRPAVFVAVDATGRARADAGRALRKLGFVGLLPGLYWTVATKDEGLRRRRVSRALRSALRKQPFVAAVFSGRAPLDGAIHWIAAPGDAP